MKHEIDDITLDALLSEPLDGVADDGFTEAVIEQMKVDRKRKYLIMCAVGSVATVLFLLFFPFYLLTPGNGEMDWSAMVMIGTAMLMPLVSLFLIADT